MEPKYVKLQTVVDEFLKGPAGKPMTPLEMLQIFQQTGNLYGCFSGTHIDARNPADDPIITEDIPCEIIEPKQLPCPGK
jgi:hypothetical protein